MNPVEASNNKIYLPTEILDTSKLLDSEFKSCQRSAEIDGFDYSFENFLFKLPALIISSMCTMAVIEKDKILEGSEFTNPASIALTFTGLCVFFVLKDIFTMVKLHKGEIPIEKISTKTNAIGRQIWHEGNSYKHQAKEINEKRMAIQIYLRLDNAQNCEKYLLLKKAAEAAGVPQDIINSIGKQLVQFYLEREAEIQNPKVVEIL